jgi:amylosucrase
LSPTGDDWLSAAASEAHRHLAQGLRGRFTIKGWREFDQRLDRHFESLFRLLHQLYGWQYDFAWTVESMVKVAADGYLQRPKRLRRADRAEMGETAPWITESATTWTSAPIESFIADPERQIDSLKVLGVTHLHLGTTWPMRALREKLETVARTLAKAGIDLVLDGVCNHTPRDHPWAQAAAGGGPEADFYFLYPDRNMPDRLVATLRNQVPERGGDSFTWHPDVMDGRWVWTTFQDDQWDLNYSNPRVLAAVGAEILSLANLGAGVVRLEHTPFLWKSPGTNCEGLPETHLVVQILRVLADLAAPRVVFLLGARATPSQVEEYVNPNECWLGYNALLMSSTWEALAAADTRLLRIALERRAPATPGCTLLNYLRNEDDLAWVFDDTDATSLGIDPGLHRQYLESFYGSGRTMGAMSGLEVALERMDAVEVDLAIRRILAAWAVLVAARGIPLFTRDDDLTDTSELSAQTKLLAGMRRLLEVRREMTGLDAMTPVEIIDPGNSAVLALRRGMSLVVANLTARPSLVERDSFPAGQHLDLIAEEIWDGHVLGPYEYRFVRL